MPADIPTIQPPPAPVAKPSFIDEVMQQARQGGAGLLANATATPFAVASGVTAAANQVGIAPDATQKATNWLQDTAKRMREGADFATGASAEPSSPGQSLARIVW